MKYNFLQITKSPTADTLKLLESNIIGTPGRSMLYQHRHVREKVNRIHNPFFVHLVRNENTVGTCCFCKRSTLNTGQIFHAFYIRYFSFNHQYRRRNVREKKVHGSSLLRNEINALLNGNGLDGSANDKFFHYAYVDPRNVRSAVLCREFGFEDIRQYATVIFSRIDPKPGRAGTVTEILPEEEDTVRVMLTDFYQQYNMFSLENLLGGRKYYVVRGEHNRILAGAQVSLDKWTIQSLPGLTGKFILNVLTKIPLLNRLFNRDYKFITLEGIYYTPGQERSLEILLETLLSAHQVNSCIMVVDADSSLYRTLKSLRLGLINALNKEVRGNVICKFVGFEETEKAEFRSSPAYLSGIDVT
jgi:hypothetical protein